MRISSDWIGEFVAIPPISELTHIFEMAGAGVESGEENVFTLEVTSNRGDWLSAIGLAREVAAMTDKRLRQPGVEIEGEAIEDGSPIAVEIEDGTDCARYLGRIITNIKVGHSPEWMQQRLMECGMRPVNNIVDVTNYVMLETGQPLHAFDADKVPEGGIVVRRARPGERLRTLDDVERELTDEVLVIADREKPIGIAGVMGGLDSEVTESTTRVLLEAAHFSPLRVRRSTRSLGLTSEASRRFERWVDPNGVRRAADRAAQLFQQVSGATISASLSDRYPQPVAPASVRLRTARCNAVLGLKLSAETITKLLERLGLMVTVAAEGVLAVTVPTFRNDVSREIDLIEEVARVHGYEHIPTTLPRTVNAMAGRSLSQRLEERAKSALLRCGLTEVVTLSMQSAADNDCAGLPPEPAVELRNPLSEDYTQMRISLIPSLLNVLRKNARSGARIFELGKVYLPQNDQTQPNECRRLGMALMPSPNPLPHWQKDARHDKSDFFALKGIVETALAELGAPQPQWQASSEPPFHPGRCATMTLDGQELGTVGELHPDVATRHELQSRAVLAIIEFDSLVRHLSLLKPFIPLSRFPVIDRDIALVLDIDTPAARVESTLRKAGGELLRNVRTFDVYTGSPIPEGSKSMALSLRFLADDRTLTDEEIEAVMARIRDVARNELGATLR